MVEAIRYFLSSTNERLENNSLAVLVNVKIDFLHILILWGAWSPYNQHSQPRLPMPEICKLRYALTNSDELEGRTRTILTCWNWDCANEEC
jgi:hypothetical protein